MKILFHYEPGPGLARQLASLAGQGFDVNWVAPADIEGFREQLPAAEIIWHVLRPLSAADIAAAPKLRLIQKIGVGVNTIDLDAARDRGIAVCNMPGTNAHAVAELALLLMLACLRRLPLLDRAVRQDRGWRLDPAWQDSFGELAGRTVGLVGYGAIPETLAPVLDALGAQILYTATAAKPAVPYRFLALDELLRRADIVSLHLPLTLQTEKIIDAERIRQMRRGAILVNTARGGLVDQTALVKALDDGHLGAAGLDVFADEPVAPTEPLLARDNVVLTPHIGWLTGGTLSRSLDIALENCRRLVSGAGLLHRVI